MIGTVTYTLYLGGILDKLVTHYTNELIIALK